MGESIINSDEFWQALHKHAHFLLSRRSLPLEEAEETYSEEESLMQSIRDNMFRHTAPSVQIGKVKSRATLPLKFHAVAHAFRLLSGDLPTMQALFRNCVVWLTDQGTEHAIPAVLPVPLLQLVPPPGIPGSEAAGEIDFAEPFVSEDQQMHCNAVEVDFGADEPVRPLRNENCVADVTGSLEINDTLHCFHNATKELSRSMTHFKQSVFRAKKVAAILKIKVVSNNSSRHV